MKIDAEKGEGIELAKQFGIRGFPTIVFANEKGEEIDRIVGYMPPEPFLKELNRIQSGKNTLPALLEDFQQNPSKFSTLVYTPVKTSLAPVGLMLSFFKT